MTSQPLPPSGYRRRVPVVLSATALGSFVSTWRATALAVAELGIAAFFLSGIVRAAVGAWTPWAVLTAAVVGALVRGIDLESWGLLMPGGLSGRAEAAFGSRAAALASATALTERLLLAATAVAVVGEYGSGYVSDAIVGWRFAARLPPTDTATVIAIGTLGLIWIRGRLGKDLSSSRLARATWVGVAVLAVTGAWAARSLSPGALAALPSLIPRSVFASGPAGIGTAVLSALVGIGLALPAVGGGNAVTRSAHEFAPPRVPTLRRTTIFATALVIVLQAGLATAFTLLVHDTALGPWIPAPVAGSWTTCVGRRGRPTRGCCSSSSPRSLSRCRRRRPRCWISTSCSGA